MVPEMSVHFTFFGIFEPGEITNLLDISPSRIWRKGEKFGPVRVHKEDAWRLSTDRKSTYELEEEVMLLIDKLYPQRIRISNLCQDMNLNIEIACHVDVDGREFPAVCLSKKTMSMAVELNADIDIDIIVSL